MRKICLMVAVLATMVVLLVGCGSSSNNIGNGGEGSSSNNAGNGAEKEEDINTSSAKLVELGGSYSVANNIEFSLYKVKSADKLQAVSGKGSYYTADSGMSYADVVISLTNNGSGNLSVRDNFKVFFESADGTRYKDALIVVEDRDDYLNQFGFIKPLASNKVHIGYKLPSNVVKGKAYFEINDDLFAIDYDSSVEISNKVTISMNNLITVDDVASFKLLSTKFTADVLPPNTSGFYSHYAVDDPANDIYFVVYSDLTNESASAIRADDMISVRAIFDGKFEYNANMALEEKDGTGFDYANITSVQPLETRKAVFMFEVPKKVQDKDYELSIYFYGNEYSLSK